MGGLEHARENRPFATFLWKFLTEALVFHENKQAIDIFYYFFFKEKKNISKKKLLFTPIYLIGALTTADLKAILFQQNNGKSIPVSQLLSF